MEQRSFPTPLGDVCLRGSAEAFRGAGPVVFAIGGALPRKGELEWLSVENAGIVYANLPGFFCPPFPSNSIEHFVEAFDSVIESAFRGRPVTAFGLSTGAVVTAGLRSPQIVGKLLVEPFFSTAKLWPLVEVIRGAMPTASEAYQRWCWGWCTDVLGIAAQTVTDRRFDHLPCLETPTVAVLGSIPLQPPRSMQGLPSFTDQDDRRLLETAGVEIVQAIGGHNIPKNDPQAIVRALTALVARTDPGFHDDHQEEAAAHAEASLAADHDSPPG
jgi:hypothetical protein